MTFGIKSIDHVCYSRKRVINMHWRMVDCHPVRPNEMCDKDNSCIDNDRLPRYLERTIDQPECCFVDRARQGRKIS
jgi:hypothetical protein